MEEELIALIVALLQAYQAVKGGQKGTVTAPIKTSTGTGQVTVTAQENAQGVVGGTIAGSLPGGSQFVFNVGPQNQ